MLLLSSYRYPSDVQLNQAADGVITDNDALADILELIEHYLNRLRIYTETAQSMPAADEMVVKLVVELISTLALVSRRLKKRRSRESFLTSTLRCSSQRSQMDEEFLWS